MKENKYGCRRSGDVCLIHSCPLLGFDFCEESEIIKDFLTTSIQQAIVEEKERVNNKIEEYFNGLIVVSLPQATKESLLESLDKPLTIKE